MEQKEFDIRKNSKQCPFCGEFFSSVGESKKYCNYICSANYNRLRNKCKKIAMNEMLYEEFKNEIEKRTEILLKRELKIEREAMR